jgi:hypothetical protein
MAQLSSLGISIGSIKSGTIDPVSALAGKTFTRSFFSIPEVFLLKHENPKLT